MTLRNILIKRWPGIFIPSLVSKSKIVISIFNYKDNKIILFINCIEFCLRGSEYGLEIG